MRMVVWLPLIFLFSFIKGQLNVNKTESASVPINLSISSLRVLKDLIVIPSSRRLYILAILPVHKSSGLECGQISHYGLETLAAFIYALNEVNRNSEILPGLELGAVILDSCSNEHRTIANLFELFATDNNYGIRWQDIVAVIQQDEQGASDRVEALFRDIRMPRMNIHSTPVAFASDNLVMGTTPSDETEVKVLAKIMSQMQWTYIDIIYDDMPVLAANAKMFELYAISFGTCVGKSVKLDFLLSLEQAQLVVRKLLLSDSRAIVLFVSDRNFVILLKALHVEKITSGRFIFVTRYNERWLQNHRISKEFVRFRQGLLTINPEFTNATDFGRELSALALAQHGVIPDIWFEQFYQQTFRCSLNDNVDDSQSKTKYSAACTGKEKIELNQYGQSYTVLPTILAVQSVARGLHNLFKNKCPGASVEEINDCYERDSRTLLVDQMRKINFNYIPSSGDNVYVKFNPKGFMTTTYSIKLLDNSKQLHLANKGKWHPSTGLLLDRSTVTLIDSRGQSRIPKSVCIKNCQHCSNLTSIRATGKRNTDTRTVTWIVVFGGMAGLGIFVCFICSCYFRTSVTPCGYLILAGLAAIYIMAFIHILNTSAAVCALRRIFTGLTWAMVFAPLLVQSVDAWRLQFNVEKRLHGPTSESSLFMISFGLICVQAIIAVEWVMLQSPSDIVFMSLYDGDKLEAGIWRCAPGEDVEKIILFSMVYVALLVLLTALFSLLTWNVDANHNQSRWVFAGSIYTIFSLCITCIISTKVTYKLREPIQASALILNATVLVIFLFIRKAYVRHQINMKIANDAESPLNSRGKLKSSEIVHMSRTSAIANGAYMHSQTFALASTNTAASSYMIARQGFATRNNTELYRNRTPMALPSSPSPYKALTKKKEIKV